MAAKRLDRRGAQRLAERLSHGDPRGEVLWAYQAKEALRDIYQITDAATAVETVNELADIMVDTTFPPEVIRLGRMLRA